MKFFVLYAITTDGTRDFLWLKRLPADFDWQGWVSVRKDAMRILNVRQFQVEEIEA